MKEKVGREAIDTFFRGGEGGSGCCISLLEGCQALPFRPSNKSQMEINILEW
jgi:hypothetical protein